MTREELKRHCLKQIEGCEMWANYKCEEPHGKIYEEHKLILELLEQEPVKDIKEYYKDIWDCDINHPRYEDTVAEIVETSYRSGYVQGVENTTKEFRFELEQKPKTGYWIFVDKAHEHAHCSECDYGDVDLMDGRPHNYCPNCGAKIIEPQESEGA